MKLRMEPGSIRVRLSHEEVSGLFENKCIEEEIRFSEEARYKYAVLIHPERASLGITLFDKAFSITLPVETEGDWQRSESFAVKTFIKADTGEDIEIVVEKDFGRKTNFKK
ncbi:MAG: hypothetical protein HC819_02605 [Cyclobacteriaceae bacterium]|nr:hypothetical protein [Cyclobacteriaceae bacterium]